VHCEERNPHRREADFMREREVTTCFNCPEFDTQRGCCKRANQLKPCIRQNNDVSAM
jgi:hypothetical protein